MAKRGAKRLKSENEASSKATTKKVSKGKGKAEAPVAKKKTKRVRRTPEQARAVILEAARKVFAEIGPDAASLEAVAAEAGVSHGLITHYFGTFEGLVEATLAEHVHAVRQRLLDQLAHNETFGAKRFIETLFGVIEDPLYGRLVAWAILSGRFQSKDFFPRKEQGLARIVDALQIWLGAQGAEDIDRDDIELALILVITAGLGYSMGKSVLWATLGHRASKARDARFRTMLADLVEQGLQERGLPPRES